MAYLIGFKTDGIEINIICRFLDWTEKDTRFNIRILVGFIGLQDTVS